MRDQLSADFWPLETFGQWGRLYSLPDASPRRLTQPMCYVEILRNAYHTLLACSFSSRVRGEGAVKIYQSEFPHVSSYLHSS